METASLKRTTKILTTASDKQASNSLHLHAGSLALKMPLFQGNGDLGTLGSLKAESRATKYDKSAIFGQKDRELYMLVVVDTTGSPVRPATDDDLRGVDLGVDGTHESQGGPVRTNEPKSKQRSRNSSFQDLLAAARNDTGPSCAHCGVTGNCCWVGLALFEMKEL